MSAVLTTLTTPSPRLPPQEFGFTPDSVLQLAAPLRRPECRVSSLILGEWQINPLALLDDAGTLAFGLADGQSSDVVLTCALLQDTERGAAVRSLDLEHIGSRLGVAGFGTVIRLIESGTMSGLTSISLRHMDMHVHMHTRMHMHMRIRMDMHMGMGMGMGMDMHATLPYLTSPYLTLPYLTLPQMRVTLWRIWSSSIFPSTCKS